MRIELKHIHKYFGPVHANNNINLTFDGGQIIGVLGENGAGKSTLMKILSGFQPADSGEIWIDGHPVDYTGPQAAIGQGIGMLQQDPLDVGAFTVLENFMYGQKGGLLPNYRQGGKLLREYTNRFGFELEPDTPIERLSIAQRQQLEIIRLLALGVKTLILDEPTTGISAEQKETLFDALRGLAREDGMIVLLVSHKLEDVIALCDRVVVLRGGVQAGERDMPATPAELVRMMFGQELKLPERDSMPPGEPILVLEHLHLHDSRLDIPDVNLSVHAGEVVGLAGLDGSGQELFMRACVGLIRPLSGRERIRGQDMVGKPYRQYLQRGVVFGAAGRLEEGLVAGLTLTEHMALVMDNQPMIDWQKAEEATRQNIQHYNIRGRASDQIEQLSGGNQQRVLMALLPARPELVILEQPTRGLDVDSAQWIWQQLLERRQHGTAIVFSSPELDELVTYSDRILVFFAGKIYEIPDVSKVTIDELGYLIGGEFVGAS
ncbi:MAG: ATP-binding cassette domain-containing protein [Anaerolineae bacterium]|nr:ATP-binding cassette domain-containing protein [Anaerolineae bacterium]